MTVLASIALFAIVVVFLADRVAAGTDPVLGAARSIQAPRPVIVRRIVRRVIVDTTVSSRGHAGAGGTTVSTAPVTTSQASSGATEPAPVTRSS